MSSYRSAPTPRPPVVIRAKRSRFHAVAFWSCVSVAYVMLILPFGRSELTCSRTQNLCSFVELRGPDLWRNKRSFELASIRHALVHERVDDKRIALDVRGSIEPLELFATVTAGDEQSEWVAQVNEFLQDPSRLELRVRYGHTWPAYVVTLVAVLVCLVWWRSGTRFVVDRVHQELQIEKRIVRTHVRIIPFDQIREVFVHKQEDTDGVAYAAAINLADDSVLPLEDYTAWEASRRKEMVARINEALAEAGVRITT